MPTVNLWSLTEWCTGWIRLILCEIRMTSWLRWLLKTYRSLIYYKLHKNVEWLNVYDCSPALVADSRTVVAVAAVAAVADTGLAVHLPVQRVH